MEDVFVVENPYLVRRLNEVHADMKARKMINDEPRLSEHERFVATLISVYEATKEQLTKRR